MSVAAQFTTDRCRTAPDLTSDLANTVTGSMKISDLDPLIHAQEAGIDHSVSDGNFHGRRRRPHLHPVESHTPVIGLGNALGPIATRALINPDSSGSLQRSHALIQQAQKLIKTRRRAPPAIRATPLLETFHHNS
jgi:hypothetical protein